MQYGFVHKEAKKFWKSVYDVSFMIPEFNTDIVLYTDTIIVKFPLETTISSSSTVMFLRQSTLSVCPLIRKFSTNNAPFVENAIAELNKEMESIFGDALSTSDLSSTNNVPIAREPHFAPPQLSEHIESLTHINSGGEAQMVDVSSKEISKRVTIAGCKVMLGKKVFDMVSANQIAKGDVLSVARIAGINGAKQTSNLIPLCHNINLTHVRVDLTLNEKDFSVEIEGEAASTGMTGVEMEAMTAVTIAGLTVYDMCKAASKDIQMMDVQLEHKSGGKSGEWSRMQ
ncbi:Cyclic pyranopterin monophosphate synthase [Thalictrum thalictroides]|uniref:cyclic pyranopterin monophosphate synthase n=1 Tax=Thalictrum thalictroides TaxID=46969 RepID=A0A7J6W4I6_THATH|nr:Cyclic pyranopterin monophosphate synthase [Thalictrum thalictroides]